MSKTDTIQRRASVGKGLRGSHTERPRGSYLDVGMHDDDDAHAHAIKRDSSVWKSGYKVKVANTYRMGPIHKFQPHLIQKKGEALIKQAFGEMTYDHDICQQVADKVAADIMAFIKKQVFDRYRYVVRVVVGDKKGQTARIASRTLWDEDKDNFLTLSHENRHLYAIGMVFALYFE